MPVGSTEALVARCQAQLDAGLVAEALAGLNQAHQAASDEGAWPAAAWAANWVGHVHEHHLDDLPAALRWFVAADRDAAAAATALPRTRSTARFNAGLVESRRGRTTAALGHFEAARTAAASSGDGGLEAICTERVGAALSELGRWRDSLGHLDRAERLATAAGDNELALSCAEAAAEAATALDSRPSAQFDRLARAGLARCLAGAGRPEPSRILDAGCGFGAELRLIAEYWPLAQVLGIDLPDTVRSVRLPRHLRRRVEVQAVDLTDPDAEAVGGPFDLAVSNAVLHAVAQPGAFLATVARALRPGGRLVGATFTDTYHRRLRGCLFAAGVAPPRPPISHTDAAIAEALAGAGFTDVETWTEAVELHVEGEAAAAHLGRVLGRTVEPDEADRILDATGRPLTIDLSPLSFSATV
jgi:SAM-dependent methyltransferase